MRVFMLGIMVAFAAIMPASANADDQQIADFIKARLMQEKQQGNLVGFNVDMRVDRGTVWFKGFVSNRSQELLILRTAQLAGHLGVVQVVDDIDVNTPYDAAAAQPQQPLMTQAKPMVAQERVAMRPQQPYTSAPRNYQAPQARPLQPQQNYMQPQTQRPVPSMNTRPNMTPTAPRRMEFPPMSSTEPKRDENTLAVAYQEPIGQPRIPSSPMNSVVNQPIQNMMSPSYTPSFQQTMNAQTPANRVSTPIATSRQPMAPPTPVASQPLPFARAAATGCDYGACGTGGGGYYGSDAGITSDSASLPGYAWPAYAAHPNYGAVSYPKQYSASAWPYIGPFYPYPQVPLGWRKVSLEWDDGWWFLDFSDK